MSRRKFLLKRERQRRNHERKAQRTRQARVKRDYIARVAEDVEREAMRAVYEIWRAG